MGGTLSIFMKEMMKLGRNLQSTHPNPQQQHYRYRRETVDVAHTL
jgi:hypothetical protein